ncbi:MAG: HD domain-containing phosphohydrolase [Bacillota bacterium]
MKRKVLLLISLIAIISTMPFSEATASEGPDFFGLIDSHGSIMTFLDPSNGRIVYVNKAAVDFYGYSKEEMESMDVYDLRTKTNYNQVPNWDELNARSRNTYQVEHRIADGSLKTMEVRSYPYQYGDRTVLFSILEDITEQSLLEENNRNKTNIIIAGGLVSMALLLYIAEARRKINDDVEEINLQLNSSKNHLELILDSTAEGIYGIDMEGRCTFCNESGLRILCYDNQAELIGTNMQEQIHHSDENGDSLDQDSCRIYKSIKKGEKAYADDEVFWRKDGTYFQVEYDSYPQYKDGEIIGAVVTFTDITEQKKIREQINYLSFHDTVTGLYNKTFFQEEMKRLDVERNLPISIIVGDINGLKLTNDILGHEAGDELIKSVADSMKEVCRADDIVARTGGDEFTILLPGTELHDAEKVCNRIKSSISSKEINIIKGNISTGCAAKTYVEQKIESILKAADESMYFDKTLNETKVSRDQLGTLTETLHKRSPRESSHAERIARLSELIGKSINLRPEVMKRLKDSAYYHDIGKIVLSEDVLLKTGKLTKEERKEVEQHPIVGYRILKLSNETVNIADIVFSHHENWDGKGYPKGLKGIEIPMLSRILSVAEAFDSLTGDKNGDTFTKEQAVEYIKEKAGSRFDPKIANAFVEIADKI